MNDITREVFDLLGVEPFEYFKVKFEDSLFDYEFYFDTELKGHKRGSDDSVYFLREILTGKYKILKGIFITEEEKETAKALRMLGVNFLARDKDCELCGYGSRPEKSMIMWETEKDHDIYVSPIKGFDFIKWEDKEAVDISYL